MDIVRKANLGLREMALAEMLAELLMEKQKERSAYLARRAADSIGDLVDHYETHCLSQSGNELQHFGGQLLAGGASTEKVQDWIRRLRERALEHGAGSAGPECSARHAPPKKAPERNGGDAG
jgi:hypothetical protein